MSSSAIDTRETSRPDPSRSIFQRRRVHPQDPIVRGVDTEINIQRIAYDIVALNVYTLRALQDGWFQAPQVVNRSRYEKFEEIMGAEAQHHVDMANEQSEHEFNAYIMEFVQNLSHLELMRLITDPRPNDYYSDVISVCLKRFHAAVAHATIASRQENMDIPAKYDFCETYQEYIEYTVVHRTETRQQLAITLRRTGSLLDSIRIPVNGRSLPDTYLLQLRDKLVALQGHYPDACFALFETYRDLFDMSAERWWESASAIATKKSTSSTKMEAPETLATVQATLQFGVPTSCLLCCIPIGLAYFYSVSEPGTITDSDFWQLVAGSGMQTLSLATMIWPAMVSTKVLDLSRTYIWFLATTSAISVPASILLYLFLSIRWSIIISFGGNIAQALILLQFINA
ncbi:hypothetical protein BKA67DRAFT_147876 [Truncatella angustata]|uniref:Uncharacterized protein n=1 Tax=Truncatella angustata TaxID=152316 RepID=A0A9P8U7M5_9PEZI|nr:uncharacterized protein BKA67DRAFT_147876 [Truncatella angustata]KAH6638511.1 hypothetical protein BKA67DRAFT_147876 [Truncatella angustata]